MSEPARDLPKLRERAEHEIALAQAAGEKAHASPDFRTIFAERRDSTQETVRLPRPN